MLTRRQFVRSISISVAVAPLALNSVFAAEGETPWLRRTLKIDMLGSEGTLEQRFERAVQAGFAGVEMNVPGVNVNQANAAARATGLIIDGTVGGYHWDVRHTDPDTTVRAAALEKLKAGIRETRAMNADTMLLVPGHGKDGTADEVYARAVEAVEAALPVAEESKVAILIENVWNHFLYNHEGGTDQNRRRIGEIYRPLRFTARWSPIRHRQPLEIWRPG